MLGWRNGNAHAWNKFLFERNLTKKQHQNPKACARKRLKQVKPASVCGRAWEFEGSFLEKLHQKTAWKSPSQRIFKKVN